MAKKKKKSFIGLVELFTLYLQEGVYLYLSNAMKNS